MLKKIIITISLLVSISLTSNPLYVNAYQIDPSYRPSNAPFDLSDEIKEQKAEGATILILQIIAGALLYFATPIATIMIAWAAFTMVTSGTEQEKLEQSKKHLTWAILGLVLILLSYSLVRIVISLALKSAGAISE